jgi:putative nucleotidyltransferase-like protein
MAGVPGSETALELVLACAGTECGESRRARIDALLRGPIDWDAVARTARAHGLVPLVERQLAQIGSPPVPHGLLEELGEQRRATTRWNLLMMAELLRLLEDFERAGVPVVPFKGPVLAMTVYGDLGLREFVDLDLLLRPGDVGRARSVLQARGYRPGFELTSVQERVLLRHHYELPFVRAADGTVVELQWRIGPRHFTLPFDVDNLQRPLMYATFLGRKVPSLAPEDVLLVLCVHGTKHLWQRLGWVVDVAETIRAYPEIDWSLILRTARRLGGERMLLLGLALARDLLGAPLPPVALARLRAEPIVATLASRCREAVRAPTPKAASLIEASAFHLRARERFRDRLRYVSGLALATTPGDWRVASLPGWLFFLYYPLRIVRLAVKYGANRSPER